MNRLERLETFLKESPEDPFLIYALAMEYISLGQPQKALVNYEKLANEQPDYVATYYQLGKLYETMEQWEKAFVTYKKGMEVAKAAGDNHTYSELAGAKLVLGDDDDFEI